MRADITTQATSKAGRTFLGWAPVEASARLADAAGASGPVAAVVRNGGKAGGGKLLFDTARSADGKPEIHLELPADGSPASFWVAGEFQQPSSEYGDSSIEVMAGNDSIGRLDVMVRVRKDAVSLTPAERDRFLNALGTLNARGQGPFQKFRDSHVADSIDEAHGFPGFPPWHRAYILDLERTLQGIDPAVALPYWRFDKAAPALFADEFLGMPPPDKKDGDVVQFPHGHPLEFWRTDGTDPIERRPRYPIAGPPPQTRQTPHGPIPWVISEAATLKLGKSYADFRGYDPKQGGLEFAPHGTAHVSFAGPINNVPSAAKDPLFFLLHCNVDRLWAKWQWYLRRWDPADQDSFSLKGPVRDPDDIGHKLDDTMWPWNGIVGDDSGNNPRPQFPPPRAPFPDTPNGAAPGATPKIRDMIDYQGVLAGQPLGFDYDDVPFELVD